MIDAFETEDKLIAKNESSNSLFNQYFKELKDCFENLKNYHPELKPRNAINHIKEIIPETEFGIILDDRRKEETLAIDFHKNEYIYPIVSLLKIELNQNIRINRGRKGN